MFNFNSIVKPLIIFDARMRAILAKVEEIFQILDRLHLFLEKMARTHQHVLRAFTASNDQPINVLQPFVVDVEDEPRRLTNMEQNMDSIRVTME